MQCRPNSNVAIKVGGNFFFDPAEFAATTPGNDPSSILLIAGGVGINPLVSILRELKAHLWHLQPAVRSFTLLIGLHQLDVDDAR